MNNTVSLKDQLIKIYENSSQYVIPPVAASIGIILPFRFFEEKASKQIMEQSPLLIVKEKLSGKIKVKPTLLEIKNTFKRGVKASPTIGIIIGSQMIAQETVEYIFNRTFNKNIAGKSDFFSMTMSSLIVGVATAPLLAAFNAQAARKSPFEAIRNLTFKETGAITFREATFLLSFRINKYVEKGMKNSIGDNIAVDYFAAFTSGVIGALFGHAPDSALTIWQAKKEICTGNYLGKDVIARTKHISSQLGRGLVSRSLGLGFFAVCYKFVRQGLTDMSLSR